MGGEFYLVAGINASVPLAYNASASEVAEAVNGMEDWVGLVLADRRELGEEDMFEWHLTFSPADGNVEQLRVRDCVYRRSSLRTFKHYRNAAIRLLIVCCQSNFYALVLDFVLMVADISATI